MTTTTELPERIRAFLLKTFPALRRSPLSETDPLLQGGAVDSLGVLEIVTFLENDVGVALRDDDVVVENFESIAAIARLAKRRAADALPAVRDQP